MKNTLILLHFIFFSNLLFSQNTAELKIELKGIVGNNKTVGVALFTNDKGFPTEIKKASKVLYFNTPNGNSIISLKNISYGNYSIVIFDDANNNKIFDTNVLGIPKEGMGISNLPKKGFSKPKFKNAMQNINQPNLSISIKMNY